MVRVMKVMVARKRRVRLAVDANGGSSRIERDMEMRSRGV